MVCRTHPDTAARRRCFHCRYPICPACQKKAFHHIFCGDRCIEAFAKDEKPTEIAVQLQNLDASLNEDLREVGDILADQFQSDLKNLEEGLDQALTALSTMIEGSSVAAGHDLESVRKEVTKILHDSDRTGEERVHRVYELQNDLLHLIKTIRALTVDLKDQVDQRSKQLIGDMELVQHRVTYVEKMVDEKSEKFFKQLEKNAEQITQKVHDFREESRGGLRDLSKLENERQTELLKDAECHSTAIKAAIEKSLQSFSTSFAAQIDASLKSVVDDIAEIALGQNKNWQDFVRSAQLSASDTVIKLRPEIAKRLHTEVESLAKNQAKEMGKISNDLHAEVKKKIVHWNSWKGRAASSLLGISIGLFAGLILFTAKPKEKDWTVIIDEKIASNDKGLRTWIDEKTAQKVLEEPPSLVPISAMTRGSLTRKEVAFTFDADEHGNAAPAILDALKARGIKVTVFLTGRFIETNPEIVKKIVADGHEVGNHLFEHVHLIDYKTKRMLVGHDELIQLLLGTEKKFKELTGKDMPKLWRAPFGEINQQQIQWAASIGYRHIGWTRSGKRSLDTLDWVEERKNFLYRSADQIERQILDFEANDPNHLNGGVVLMHLGTLRKNDFPHQKLPQILDEVLQRGYKVVPVTQVLRTELALK